MEHVISNKRVAVDPDKITTMLKWPKSNIVKGLHGFLGLTSYYRMFIRNYGQIARPLTQMPKKGCFKWSPKAKESFAQLKKIMAQTLNLALPDFKKPFILECDASGSGIGGVLMQDKRLIAFF